MKDSTPQPKIVNVASVPQRSPLRYPGGKTWLVPYVRRWLGSLPAAPRVFAEPFLGGGIVSLTVGFERLADSVAMAELDEDVAAVWRVVLGEDAPWLADRVKRFDVSPESVRAELSKRVGSTRGRAFHTLLRNRTAHGGILARGGGLMKGGENGKGIASRWYPDTLRKRVLDIAGIRDRFTFSQGDGIKFIARRAHCPATVFFIDPPYTAGKKGKRAGRRLYTHCDLDHERLFDAVKGVSGDFLMTYDHDDEVLAMARERGFDTEAVPMRNTHHAEMRELLIGRDLDWARRARRDGLSAETVDLLS